jgi:hypothetical protein
MVLMCSYARTAEKDVAWAEAGATAGGTICATTRKATNAIKMKDPSTGSQAGEWVVVLATNGELTAWLQRLEK